MPSAFRSRLPIDGRGTGPTRQTTCRRPSGTNCSGCAVNQIRLGEPPIRFNPVLTDSNARDATSRRKPSPSAPRPSFSTRGTGRSRRWCWAGSPVPRASKELHPWSSLRARVLDSLHRGVSPAIPIARQSDQADRPREAGQKGAGAALKAAVTLPERWMLSGLSAMTGAPGDRSNCGRCAQIRFGIVVSWKK